MSFDPIVEETRAHREAIARELGGKVETIVAALKQREGRDGRPVADFTENPRSRRPISRKIG